MKKYFLFVSFFLSIIMNNWAQSGFNYKAVIAQNDNVLQNQSITLYFRILENGSDSVFEEYHMTTTDDHGIVIVNIGEGELVSGNFEEIDWSASQFINVQVNTGTGYMDFGTTALQYVPYAKYADSAANGFSGNYNDLINKPLLANAMPRGRRRVRRKIAARTTLPSQHLGYDILLKLGALSIAAPIGEGLAVWEPVLSHGPAAHYALQHFIRGLFLRLGEGDDPVAFERVWRAAAEYGLAANWSQPGLWFYGERLICDLLGFGNEHTLSRLNPGAALRMKDVYERWAAAHLANDEECITRFCHLLATNFGAQLRLDGLRWVAAALR